MAKYMVPAGTAIRMCTKTGTWFNSQTTKDILFDTKAPRTSVSVTSMEFVTYLDNPVLMMSPHNAADKFEIVAWSIGDFVLSGSCKYLGE